MMTWSPFEYIGSLVLFTKFNHMSKKKKKTISHQISDQSYASKKICIRAKWKLVPKKKKQKKKKKSRQKMLKPN